MVDGKIRQETGFAYPEICPKCGKYYEGYNGNYSIDSEIMCGDCVKNDKRLKIIPYFVTNRPTYCDGGTTSIFTFGTIEMFYEKIKNRLSEGCMMIIECQGMILK